MHTIYNDILLSNQPPPQSSTQEPINHRSHTPPSKDKDHHHGSGLLWYHNPLPPFRDSLKLLDPVNHTHFNTCTQQLAQNSKSYTLNLSFYPPQILQTSLPNLDRQVPIFSLSTWRPQGEKYWPTITLYPMSEASVFPSFHLGNPEQSGVSEASRSRSSLSVTYPSWAQLPKYKGRS
jgi:hypothetical protein